MSSPDNNGGGASAPSTVRDAHGIGGDGRCVILWTRRENVLHKVYFTRDEAINFARRVLNEACDIRR